MSEPNPMTEPTTNGQQSRFGMTSRVIVLVLISLFALANTSSPVSTDRTDLPLRTRIARRIGDGFRFVKTRVVWAMIGKTFLADDDPSALMQGPIDDEWIDAALPQDGLLKSSDEEESFGDEFPPEMVIPREQWAARIAANQAARFSPTMYVSHMHFQAPEHSCVSNATTTAVEVVWFRQTGYQVKLSPMSLYCRMNSRRWGGSSVFGNLIEAAERGILPEDTPGNRRLFGSHVTHENTPYFQASELPSGWESTAKHFRPLLFFRIRTKEQFATALLRGWPIVDGRDGHSICHLELVVKDGRFLSKYADSYGEGRGDGGYLYDSEGKWSTNGTWCLVSVAMPDNPRFPAGISTDNQTTLAPRERRHTSHTESLAL